MNIVDGTVVVQKDELFYAADALVAQRTALSTGEADLAVSADDRLKDSIRNVVSASSVHFAHLGGVSISWMPQREPKTQDELLASQRAARVDAEHLGSGLALLSDDLRAETSVRGLFRLGPKAWVQARRRADSIAYLSSELELAHTESEHIDARRSS